MILLRPTDSEIMEANRRANSMGILPSSRLKGRGNIIGFLGEILVMRYCGGTTLDDFDSDILLNGLRVDVKTKSCASPPKPSYYCSVMQYQLQNETDAYIFTRINLTAKAVWLCGFITKDRFLAEAIPFKKGDLDETFAIKEDCLSISIFDLDPVPTNE